MGLFSGGKRTQQQAAAIAVKLMSDPSTPPALLAQACNANPALRPVVAANPGAPLAILEKLAELGDPAIDGALAGNPTWTAATGVAPPTRPPTEASAGSGEVADDDADDADDLIVLDVPSRALALMAELRDEMTGEINEAIAARRALDDRGGTDRARGELVDAQVDVALDTATQLEAILFVTEHVADASGDDDAGSARLHVPSTSDSLAQLRSANRVVVEKMADPRRRDRTEGSLEECVVDVGPLDDLLAR